jgi:hypothetical protein
VQELCKFLQERAAVELKYASLLSSVGKPGAFGGKRLDSALLSEHSYYLFRTLKSALSILVTSVDKEAELHRKLSDHINEISRALLDFDQRLGAHKKTWMDVNSEEVRRLANYRLAVENESRRLNSYETEMKRLVAKGQHSKATDKVRAR